jgi:small GTP-binding protein
MPGLIAIVGRPNVGKSALFNRLAGRRIAIVHDQPGVTRDRVSAEAEWHGQPFTLVDTGGIGLLRGEKAGDVIARAALEQVELAIAAADVIVLVVNMQEGITPLDREVADRLRSSGKPVLVAANKTDNAQVEDQAVDFSPLGYDRIFPVSAIHNRGIADLMDAAMPPAARRGPGSRPCVGRSGEARCRGHNPRPAPPGRAAQDRHRRPPQRRQKLHHQRPDPVRACHRQPHSRHHARRGGCPIRGRDRRRAFAVCAD